MIYNHDTIRRWFAHSAKRWPLLALLTVACVFGATAPVAAAAHETNTVSPDTLCGFTGTSYWVFDLGNGPSVTGLAVRTFVADNGRGVKITYQAGAVKVLSTVTNPDGSSSVTLVEDGSNFKVQALGGRLLEQGTGRLAFIVNFDANGNIVSETTDYFTGPETNFTGVPDCSVIGPSLAGS